MTNGWLRIVPLVAMATLWSCGGDAPVFHQVDTDAAVSDDGGQGESDLSGRDVGTPDVDAGTDSDAGNDSHGRIDIYMAGDLDEVTFDDGLAGQTPRAFKVAISAYEVLTSASATPQPCFDHGDQPVVADLGGDTLVGTCLDVPTGVYTHGRTRVEWVSYTVDGTLHRGGGSFPGDVTFFRATSNTRYDGEDYAAGEGWMHYEGITDITIPMNFDATPSAPGIVSELDDGGHLWMQFAYTHPLPVVSGTAEAHWARFYWAIFQGFRWRDSSGPGYADRVWDMQPGSAEEVVVPGVTGYRITSSIDE